MTLAQKNQQIKKSQKRMVTIVTSVNGKPLEEVAPGLKNEFENYVEAFRQIQKATGKRPDLVFTRRVNAASLVRS